MSEPTVFGDISTLEQTLEKLRRQKNEGEASMIKIKESIALYTRLLGYARLAQKESE